MQPLTMLENSEGKVNQLSSRHKKLKECISKMAEEILLLEEIKKETEGVEISLIAEKVSAILNRKRTHEDF